MKISDLRLSRRQKQFVEICFKAYGRVVVCKAKNRPPKLLKPDDIFIITENK